MYAMRLSRLIIARAFVLGTMFPATGIAQEKHTANVLKLTEGVKSPAAKVGDLAWLQGRWVGAGLGGTVEEVWTPPMGDSMLGLFRLVKDGKIVFSEHCVIAEAEGSVVFKVKHFDKDFKAWEEKDQAVTFRLINVTPNEAFFDGVTVRKTGDDSLKIFVAIKNKKTGQVKEEEFRYRKAKAE